MKMTKVESSTKPGLFYTVTEDEEGAACTHPFYQPGSVCRHIAQVWRERALARFDVPKDARVTDIEADAEFEAMGHEEKHGDWIEQAREDLFGPPRFTS